MAGPEPYAQVKWTREQDEAYAEGRRSAQAAAKGQPSRSGRRRRIVRTEAGSRRYKVPIGAEIGSARNASAAEAQKDTESTGRYADLVGTDQAAQAEALGGLDNSQLQRLSQVAYSFKSSNPDVVRLRIGVANELRRRGMNVNDFGGLGGGSARPTGPAPRRVGKKKVVIKKAKAPAPKPKIKPARSAMQARKNDRRLREMSVPQLRKALGVFGRVAPDKRQAAARVLVRRAVELSATHLLGASVVEAANISGPEAIELAGRWKHGWIPLDATAMRAKMKGGNGKPWWSGGKQSRRGNSTSMSKSVEAGRKVRAAREARRTPTTRPRVINQPEAAAAAAKKKPAPFVAVPKQGGSNSASGGELRKGFPNNKDTRQKYGAIQIKPETRQKIHDAEVKTAQKKAALAIRRKANVAENKIASAKYFRESSTEHLQEQLDRWEANPGAVVTASDRSLVEKLRAELVRRRTSVVKLSPKPERGSKMNKPLLANGGTAYDVPAGFDDWPREKKLAWEEARRQRVYGKSGSAMKGSDADRTRQAEADELAANFVKMHGREKARAKLSALQNKKRMTQKDRSLMVALGKAIDGSSGKA
jgi:hypothetical protein